MSASVSIDRLADAIAQRHAEWFVEHPDGAIPHTCLIFPETGDAVAVACAWNGARERAVIMAALREIMIQSRAVRYAFWCEAWVRTGAPSPDYQHGDIALDPARFEIVFTIVVDASGKTASRSLKIVRGDDGCVSKLEPMDEMDSIAGAFANLLPPRTTH